MLQVWLKVEIHIQSCTIRQANKESYTVEKLLWRALQNICTKQKRNFEPL